MGCDHIKLNIKVQKRIACTGSPKNNREAWVVCQKLRIIGYRDTEYNSGL